MGNGFSRGHKQYDRLPPISQKKIDDYNTGVKERQEEWKRYSDAKEFLTKKGQTTYMTQLATQYTKDTKQFKKEQMKQAKKALKQAKKQKASKDVLDIYREELQKLIKNNIEEYRKSHIEEDVTKLLECKIECKEIIQNHEDSVGQQHWIKCNDEEKQPPLR